MVRPLGSDLPRDQFWGCGSPLGAPPEEMPALPSPAWPRVILYFKQIYVLSPGQQSQSCLPVMSVSPNRLPSMFSIPLLFPTNFCLPSSMRSESFHDIILYIKPLFPLYKQFSIDSFFDLKGPSPRYFAYHSHYAYRSRTSIFILTSPMYRTRYN